jgi:hypothetical protein
MFLTVPVRIFSAVYTIQAKHFTRDCAFPCVDILSWLFAKAWTRLSINCNVSTSSFLLSWLHYDAWRGIRIRNLLEKVRR